MKTITLEFLRSYKAELFEDGVEADLADAGITSLAEAYRQGREDMLEELANLLENDETY